MGDNGFHTMATCHDCRKIGRIASTALGNPTPVELDTLETTEVGLVRMLAARLAEAVAALHGIAHADTEASALRLRFMAADALIAHNTASSAEPREDAAHG
ncbi:MAG: hypothetical protein U1F09_12990 [Steroidobacteraceae bacterium]